MTNRDFEQENQLADDSLVDTNKLSVHRRLLRLAVFIEGALIGVADLAILMLQLTRGCYDNLTLFPMLFVFTAVSFMVVISLGCDLDYYFKNHSKWLTLSVVALVDLHLILGFWFLLSPTTSKIRKIIGHLFTNYGQPLVKGFAVIFITAFAIVLIIVIVYSAIKWVVWNGYSSNFIALTRKGNIKRINRVSEINLDDNASLETIVKTINQHREDINKQLKWWELH